MLVSDCLYSCLEEFSQSLGALTSSPGSPVESMSLSISAYTKGTL